MTMSVCPNCRKRATASLMWVDLPLPSPPSKVINLPRRVIFGGCGHDDTCGGEEGQGLALRLLILDSSTNNDRRHNEHGINRQPTHSRRGVRSDFRHSYLRARH